MTDLKTWGTNILFTWCDEETAEFTTSFGLVIQRKLDKTRPRWGKIIAVGSLSTAVAGEYLLPENVPEPYGAHHEIDSKLVEVWRTTDERTICVTDDITATYCLNGDY